MTPITLTLELHHNNRTIQGLNQEFNPSAHRERAGIHGMRAMALRLKAMPGQDWFERRASCSDASKRPVTTNSNRSFRNVMNVGSVDTTAAAG